MSQPARLLNYLQQHKSITRLEAATHLGIMNLWARIADLEELEFVIQHEEQVEVVDRFGKKCRVTRYTLISEPERVAV